MSQTGFSQQELSVPDSTAAVVEGFMPDFVPALEKEASSFLDAPINYNARDSMPISLENGEQVIYLYGEAMVEYGSLKLTADFIRVNFAEKEIFASGTIDSLGNLVGKPNFSEGDQKFDCKTLRYNFVSKKGFAEEVVTEQQDGYVRSAKTKMLSQDVFCMVDGKYSACDAPHPHFYLQMEKGKLLKDKAIITGRAYLVLEDFPIYFPFLPYGYIPTNKKTYTSGVIIPSYGEESRWGFYLKDGGFYWAASDYFDMKLTGDVYSKGSWGFSWENRYRLRYKFSGSLGFRVAENVTGEKGINQNSNNSFKITWSHNQDPKANPSMSFGANVDFSTAGFSKMNEYDNAEKYLSNTTTSSINFRKTFLNTPFSFNANARVIQDTRDSTLAVTLPSMTLNMKTIEPFKQQKRVGKKKVYEDIKLSYTASIQNSIKSKESEILSTPFSSWKKSIDHNLPITLPQIKLLSNINITPSISYKERWFFDYIEKTWVDGYAATDEETGLDKWVKGHVETTKFNGFKRYYEFSGGVGANTTMYGTYVMKDQNWKLKAIRHKIDLSCSFNYHPDFGKDFWGFYSVVQTDSLGKLNSYSYFENGGISNTSSGESGSIGFGMRNNLEMKLANTNSKDTLKNEKTRKVAIFDNLSFNGSYNLVADSMKLSPISMNLSTKISGYSINISGSLNPYALDEKGKVYNEYMWNHAKGIGRLGRLTNLNTGFNFNYSSDKLEKALKGNEKKKETNENNDDKNEKTNQGYSKFVFPWTVSAGYSFSFQNYNNQPRIIQSLNFNGTLNLTDKWKSSFSSGFDIEELKLTHTTMSVTRDLHCWSMSFNFSPVGRSKYYTFTLNANASMLKDLKVNKTSRSSYGY